jgi:hypothetical protein
MEISEILKRLALNEEEDLIILKTYLYYCELISKEKYESNDFNLENLRLSDENVILLESFKDIIISNDNEETKMLEKFKTLRNVNLKASVAEVIQMISSAGQESETSQDTNSKNNQKKKRWTIIQIGKEFGLSLSEIDFCLNYLGLEIQNSYTEEQVEKMLGCVNEKRTETPKQTAETAETTQQKAGLSLAKLDPILQEGATQLKEDILAGILRENQAVINTVMSAYRRNVMASLSEPSFVAQVRDTANREKLRINAARPYVAVLDGAPGSIELEASVEEVKPENNEDGL